MKIEIWSDVVCPWCYIGKRRLEHALGEFEHADEVEIAWRSFQLNPDTPAGTAVPTSEYLVQRFGPQASQMTGRVAALGRDEGLNLDFDAALTVNTLDAHRLLRLAADLGVGDAAKERLLRAHFTEGADLSDPETLVRLAAEAGVDSDRARAVLAGTEYADAVRADIELAQAFGATGVPFFVIDRKYGISGAQPAETFLQALRTAYAEETQDRGAPTR
ncbi:MAG TPA: DsbA family oxidoreductase [Streptosporangiaceae bacterium]|nr:DsbA family oxidoreductase [Streptosporangiaceae bacterium]